MGKEFLRFKVKESGKYLTWTDNYGGMHFNIAGTGSGRSAKNLVAAMNMFETMMGLDGSKYLPCPLSSIILVKQEAIINETVVGSGDEVRAAVERKKALDEKKKRYNEFLELQKEFSPSSKTPPVPQEILDEEVRESAGSLVNAVANNLLEGVGDE